MLGASTEVKTPNLTTTSTITATTRFMFMKCGKAHSSSLPLELRLLQRLTTVTTTTTTTTSARLNSISNVLLSHLLTNVHQSNYWRLVQIKSIPAGHLLLASMVVVNAAAVNFVLLFFELMLYIQAVVGVALKGNKQFMNELLLYTHELLFKLEHLLYVFVV